VAGLPILRPLGGRVSINCLHVELCGCLADPYGRRVELQWTEAGKPVRNLIADLLAAYPDLVGAINGRTVRVCINETLVSEDSLVRIGDEVALFPPVSGG
jgi:molybdopterin synthase sulfur carrier subunit